MVKSRGVVLTKRDRDTLKYLWKWKIASTSTVSFRLWEKRNSGTTYHRLNKLERAGYLTTVLVDKLNGWVWTLTKRGFDVIKSDLDGLKEEGYRSEFPYHDVLVSALHQGDWLGKTPAGVRLFSEQELRRIHNLNYPKGIPQSDLHRADGYWRFKDPATEKTTTVAIEVETTIKSDGNYPAVGSFYSRNDEVHRVLWLVSTKKMADKLAAELVSAVSDRGNIHNFVEHNAFMQFCWQTKIVVGPDTGKTISEHLLTLIRPTPGLQLAAGPRTQFFDTTKKGGGFRYLEEADVGPTKTY